MQPTLKQHMTCFCPSDVLNYKDIFDRVKEYHFRIGHGGIPTVYLNLNVKTKSRQTHLKVIHFFIT